MYLVNCMSPAARRLFMCMFLVKDSVGGGVMTVRWVCCWALVVCQAFIAPLLVFTIT